jgi:hypothetical protein
MRAPENWETKMARLIVAVLVAIGISLATTAVAKEGCGSGFHLNKHGKCVANGKHPGKPCPAHHHLGPHGHCQPN